MSPTRAWMLAILGAGILLVVVSRTRILVTQSVPASFLTPATSNKSTGEPSNIPSSGGGEYCKWTFSHYESSEYETSWFERIQIAQKNICSVVAEPEHEEVSKVIVGRTLNLLSLPASVKLTSYDSSQPTLFNVSDKWMSRMHYNRLCYEPESASFKKATGAGVQLIEPLWGMLRDPFDHWCGAEALHMPGQGPASGQSKAHIMPQGYAPYTYSLADEQPDELTLWRSHGIPPWHSSLHPSPNRHVGIAYRSPRNIHLDLGSSYFGRWGAQDAAASGHWFYDIYHARGQLFDRFIAVELETLDDTVAFEQIPSDLVGIYTLMNVGLSMEEGDKLNVIDMIKRVVEPEDFFVFKLDIDSAPIEEPIIASLLQDDPRNGGASGLIDELMFEHHVNFDPMNGPWGNPQGVGDLARSYKVFRDLRRKGIRAHSWP